VRYHRCSGTDCLTSISACPFTIGAKVGELLIGMLHESGNVAVVTGSLATEDHREKLDGFRSTLQSLASRNRGCRQGRSDYHGPLPQLVPLIRSGMVVATVHQRPLSQGRLSFNALQQFLIEGKCPLPKIRIAPHIVMSSNLDLFIERLALEEREDLPAFGAALA
jgi:LacI family transcriptional regulator